MTSVAGGGIFGTTGREIPGLPGLPSPAHEQWNRLHRTPSSFPTPPSSTWSLKTELDMERERHPWEPGQEREIREREQREHEKEKEREREREREREKEREREQQRKSAALEAEKREKELERLVERAVCHLTVCNVI